MTCPAPVENLSPDLRRVLADNPSPMTHTGTNTYLLGVQDLTLIDPGPDSDRHLQAILNAVQPGQKITRILVTHAHRDHSALCPRLSAATGAPVFAFGAATAGRSPRMQALAAVGLTGGGEGIDHSFVPDQLLKDGEILQTRAGEIQALWTPGHMGNHLSFVWRDMVFTGDVVMGWASSLVSPPDGDLSAFLNSCAQLADLGARVFYPGHGAPITATSERCRALITHRKNRETQILQALGTEPQSIPALVGAIYTDLPPHMAPAAARNVLAHLIALCDTDRAHATPTISQDATFTSAQKPDKTR